MKDEEKTEYYDLRSECRLYQKGTCTSIEQYPKQSKYRSLTDETFFAKVIKPRSNAFKVDDLFSITKTRKNKRCEFNYHYRCYDKNKPELIHNRYEIYRLEDFDKLNLENHGVFDKKKWTYPL